MQYFDKLFLSAVSDIARAGEIVAMVSANITPKLNNLFFIFPLSFRFVFVDGGPVFLVATTKNLLHTWSGGEATTQNSPIFSLGK